MAMQAIMFSVSGGTDLINGDRHGHDDKDPGNEPSCRQAGGGRRARGVGIQRQYTWEEQARNHKQTNTTHTLIMNVVVVVHKLPDSEREGQEGQGAEEPPAL